MKNPDDRLGVVTDAPPCFCDSCNYFFDMVSSMQAEGATSEDAYNSLI